MRFGPRKIAVPMLRSVATLSLWMAWPQAPSHEPEFEGKSLTYWLVDFFPANGPTSTIEFRRSQRALEAIGEAGAPWYSKWVLSKQSGFKRSAIRTWNKLLIKLNSTKWVRDYDYERAYKSLDAIRNLDLELYHLTPAIIEHLGDKEKYGLSFPAENLLVHWAKKSEVVRIAITNACQHPTPEIALRAKSILKACE